MKKKYLLILIFVSTTLIQNLHAQAIKYGLFEHFTQASCGPCAQQNPAFIEGIYKKNLDKVRHIAYHTSWPGIDPMYDQNPTQIADRTAYYGVTGVPDMYMNGNQKNSSPAGFTQQDVADAVAGGSPIAIKVKLTPSATDNTADIIISTVGEIPTGNWKLLVAVIEKQIVYTVAPGSNGEKVFPNVFRQMLPSIDGETVAFANIGNEVTYSYTFPTQAAWNLDEIQVIAFIQDANTKQVLNTGANFDPSVTFTTQNPDQIVKKGSNGTVTSFNVPITSLNNETQQYKVVLSTNAPNDWTSFFEINGTSYDTEAEVTLNALGTQNINLTTLTGNTPFLATYTITVTSLIDPNDLPIVQNYYVISGVTDLIVNNSAPVSDNSGYPSDWSDLFENAFAALGSTSYAVTNEFVASRAIENGAASDVKHLYFNVGWSFPGLTDDLSAQFSTFYDNGGNIFMCGQDLAWAAFDGVNSPYVTVAGQNFLKNYMGVNFVDDGPTAVTKFNAVLTEKFQEIGNININAFYGASAYFPDNLQVINNGIEIFKYNSNNKTAGIRTETNANKTVYFAPGIEMLGTANNKQKLLTITYNYFHENITAIEYQNQIQQVMGQCFPNPAKVSTTIPLYNVQKNTEIQIIDNQGRIVKSEIIAPGTTQYTLSVNNLLNGAYFYRLVVNGKNGDAKKIIISK